MYTTSGGETPPEPTSGRPAPPPPLTEALLEVLRARTPEAFIRTEPLAASADGAVAVYRTSYDPEFLRAWLETNLGVGGFTESYEVVEAGAACTALCRLKIGPLERAGAAREADPNRALEGAFVNAALAFMVGANVPALGDVALRRTAEGWTRLDGGGEERLTLLRRRQRF